MCVYIGIKRVSCFERVDYPEEGRMGRGGMYVGEHGAKKYGDRKIVCRKTRNYHQA
jgi:hypothetical protein